MSLDRTKSSLSCVCIKISGSRALFTGPTNTFFSKIFIKTGFYDTIHTFKNYFVTVFLIFNFSNKSYLNRPKRTKLWILLPARELLIDRVLTKSWQPSFFFFEKPWQPSLIREIVGGKKTQALYFLY